MHIPANLFQMHATYLILLCITTIGCYRFVLVDPNLNEKIDPWRLNEQSLQELEAATWTSFLTVPKISDVTNASLNASKLTSFLTVPKISDVTNDAPLQKHVDQDSQLTPENIVC